MNSKTIILISGSQILMDANKRILEREGFSVVCASGLSNALEHIEAHKPDAIVLEYALPDGDGLESLRKLRADNRTPILVLSDDKENEVAALRAGASDYLKKPFNYNVLIARVNHMISEAERFDFIMESYDRRMSSIDGNTARTVALQQKNTPEMTAEQEILSITLKPRERRRYDSRMRSDNAFRAKGAAARAASHYKYAAACIAVLLVAAGAITILLGVGAGGVGAGIVLEDGQAPLAEVPFMAATTHEFSEIVVNGTNFYFPDNVTIPAGATYVNIPLANPAGNDGQQMFEISLADTGEVLFVSDLASPGENINVVSLTRALETGDYKAALIIKSFEPGGGADEHNKLVQKEHVEAKFDIYVG